MVSVSIRAAMRVALSRTCPARRTSQASMTRLRIMVRKWQWEPWAPPASLPKLLNILHDQNKDPGLGSGPVAPLVWVRTSQQNVLLSVQPHSTEPAKHMDKRRLLDFHRTLILSHEQHGTSQNWLSVSRLSSGNAPMNPLNPPVVAFFL